MLDKWSLFLQYAPDQKHREKVNEVIESEKVLQMTGNLLMSISQDEKEQAVFRSRRMAETDRLSDLATAMDKGMRKATFKVARNLLKMNLPLEQIAAATGLSLDDLAKLNI